MKHLYPCIINTSFCVGLIAMFITAYIGDVEVGWEIWWEVPMVVIMCISSWLVAWRR